MTSKKDPFNLDKEIDRRAVPALKTHKMVLGPDGAALFAAGVADMDFQAPPCIISAMQKRLQHAVFGYEAVPDDLFPALTGWFQRRHGWQIDQSHILRAPNILNILAIAASIFTNQGDGVIIQPPVFFDFYDILHENNRKIAENPLIFADGRYTIDFDGLEKLAANPENKMIYLCNPHNPIGRVWTRDELTRLGNICIRHNVLVVSDEIHSDLVFSQHKHTPFASISSAFADNSITCLSPAKTFNIASCCSAFTIISNPELRNAFQIENSRLTVNKNNAFASVAMQAGYEKGDAWLDAVLDYLETGLLMVRSQLADIEGVDLIEPEGTFLLWLDFRQLNLSPDQLTHFLRNEAGWAVTRGQAFGKTGEGFARLNIACTHAKLQAALARLASAMATLPQ